MDRVFVIAKRWDDAKRAQVDYIAGEFNDFMNASIFRDAYAEYYQTTAKVVTEYELINKRA